MKTTPVVSVLMAWVMVLVPCLQLTARGANKVASTPKAAGQVFFDTALDSSNPASVYSRLSERQTQRKLTFEENMDLAMSLGLQQDWTRAAGVYQAAAGMVDDPTKKAGALCGAAQSLGNAHRWREAGLAMNQVNKLAPSCKEAAALRLLYWSNAGDPLEKKTAQDRIQQLNLSSEGTPVVEPLTIIAVALIVSATVTMVTWIVVTKPNADDMLKVAAGMFRTNLAAMAPAILQPF